LLPRRLPTIPGVRLWAVYDPVGRIGGDLYDVVQLDEHRFGIFIGDIAGHGLPAALMGSMAKMAFSVYAPAARSPALLLDILNRHMLEHTGSEHYLTCFYGILDTQTWSFTYTRAGHPHPILSHASGEQEVLDSPGMLVGALRNPGFGECETQLTPGDRIYLFTDGCYETVNSAGVRFRQHDFNRLLRRHGRLPIERVFGATQEAIQMALGPNPEQEDDSTFLALEIVPHAP
jgi:serine phosphatase RsbU (regulator of sigma subunit)